jgi:glycosyltransferase involved in cell wall biosynthesis
VPIAKTFGTTPVISTTSPRPSRQRFAIGQPAGAGQLDRVLLIVPSYNEAANISAVLGEIALLRPACDVVVVDDGSTDGTSSRVIPPAVCLRHVCNLGIGAAVQTGVRYARQHDYALALQVDGDGQHPPDQVATLLAAYRNEPADVIVGSRYLGPGNFRSTMGRRIGSRVIGWTLKRLYGGPLVTDPTSGMRLFGARAIALFADRYPHDYPEPISLAWALREGFTVREVPVTMRARASGQSSIGGIRRLSYMIRVVSYILLSRAGQRR